MSRPLPLSDDDLHGYADGQLTPERAREVAALMQQDPALAARAAEIRATNARLRDATDAWLSEPLPRRLISAATSAPVTRRAWLKAWPAVAAAASLAIGLGLGWLLRGEALQEQGTPITFARQAALTHVLYATDVNRPVEIWASEEDRLVRWLSRRLSFPLRAPNLNSVGFALVGGRLVAGNQKPAALFMYENADKQRISLLVRRDAEPVHETAFRYALEDGVGVFYWIDDSCGYALSGNIDRQQLLSIARMVYGQLAAAEAAPGKPAEAAPGKPAEAAAAKPAEVPAAKPVEVPAAKPAEAPAAKPAEAAPAKPAEAAPAKP
jgi:anti-sigma factor RsiW